MRNLRICRKCRALFEYSIREKKMTSIASCLAKPDVKSYAKKAKEANENICACVISLAEDMNEDVPTRMLEYVKKEIPNECEFYAEQIIVPK